MSSREFRYANFFKRKLRTCLWLVLFNVFNILIFVGWWILNRDLSACRKIIIGSFILGASFLATIGFVILMWWLGKRHILATDDDIELRRGNNINKKIFYRDVQQVIVNIDRAGQVMNVELKTSSDTMYIGGAVDGINQLIEYIENHLSNKSIVQKNIFSSSSEYVKGTKSKGANKRSAPVLCIFFGVLLALFAAVMTYAGRLDSVNRAHLRQVSGRVESFTRTNRPKAGTQLNIFLRDDGGQVSHLIQDDITEDVPKIRFLRAGDTVSALVEPGFLCNDLYWFWDLHRGNDSLLTYEQTFRFHQKKAERIRAMGYAVAGVAIFLLALGGLLRLYFGAWSSAK